MTYLEEIQKGMQLLHGSGYTFVGQAVEYKGTGISTQIQKLDSPRVLELPVAEDFQCGVCLGMAINGEKVVSVYPRFDFTILALNQIVNHMDKWEDLHGGKVHVITKVVVGSEFPLNPGYQHKSNHSTALRLMCKNTRVVELLYPHQIYKEYQRANEFEGSTILVEHADLYTASQ